MFLGIGFGAYSAVDFALVMDVLPDEKDKAKDLAVWHQVNFSGRLNHLGPKILFQSNRFIFNSIEKKVLDNYYLITTFLK